MGVFDEIRSKGASYRLTEEALFAEALREIESGARRDGLWAKALADTDMDEGRAKAKYLKMRVQSMKDEAALLMAEMKRLGPQDETKPKKQAPLPVAKEPEKPMTFSTVLIAGLFFLACGYGLNGAINLLVRFWPSAKGYSDVLALLVWFLVASSCVSVLWVWLTASKKK